MPGPTRSRGEGQRVTLEGSFTDPGMADTHTLLWQVSAPDGHEVASGSGQRLQFTPADQGTYTARFTVTDDEGPATRTRQ